MSTDRNPYKSETTDDDFTIVSLDHYQEAAFALYSKDELAHLLGAPSNTYQSLLHALEEDYYSQLAPYWAVPENQVYAYLKEQYDS